MVFLRLISPPHLKRIPKVTRSAKLCNRFNGDFHAHINGNHKRHVIGKARDINEAQTIELGRELKQRVDNESMIKRQAKSAAALKTHLKTTKPRPKLEFFSNVADAEKFVLALSEYWSLLTTLPWTQDNHQHDLKHETLKLPLLQIFCRTLCQIC